MKLVLIWSFRFVMSLALLLVLLAWGAGQWLTAPQTRARVTQDASEMLGVPVSLVKMDLQIWPQPALQVHALTLQTQPTITLEQLALRPAWGQLLRGRLGLAAVSVQGMRLNQRALDKLILLQKKKHLSQDRKGLAAKPINEMQNLPRRVDLNQIDWFDDKGKVTRLGGHLEFGPAGDLDTASVHVLSGPFDSAQVQLARSEQRWSVRAWLAGGSVTGWISARRLSNAQSPLVVSGELQTRQLEVGRLTRPTVLSGSLEADTTLSAQAPSWGDVAEQLQTQSRFTIRQAVVHGLDLERAVRTAGLSRGGQTPLDVLTGQLNSYGTVLQFTQLAATSGALSATGQVRVSSSAALSGQVQVMVRPKALGAAVGVPLEIGGTLADPQVSLTRSAMLGAAIGTVLMPGVGTGAGASLGDRLGTEVNKLFGR